MAINAIETSDQQQLQVAKGANVTYTRSWKVTTDEQGPLLYDIQAACGVFTGQLGPGGTTCTAVRIQGTESRYLYNVQAEYAKPDKVANPLNEPDSFAWSFALTSAPAVLALPSQTSTNFSKKILNTAGEPLEEVSREIAEVRLKIAGNRATFPPGAALNYVNCVNLDSYAGSAPGTWKIQGIEAQTAVAETDNGSGGTATLNYWKVSIDLAWRREGWSLKLLNVGWNEKSKLVVSPPGQPERRDCEGKLVPICVPRIEDYFANTEDKNGNKSPTNAWETKQAFRNDYRAQHRASDVQALDEDGAAKGAGQPPDILEFFVYPAVTFAGVIPAPPAS